MFSNIILKHISEPEEFTLDSEDSDNSYSDWESSLDSSDLNYSEYASSTESEDEDISVIPKLSKFFVTF